MPTIGWFEILIVVSIAIIVLGPKDFPIMLKKVGSWIGTAKNYINKNQNFCSMVSLIFKKKPIHIKKIISTDIVVKIVAKEIFFSFMMFSIKSC